MTKSNDYGLLLQLARNTVRRKHFDAPGPYLVENFATEVLAIAIRVDPAPIKRLLSDLPALAGRESRSVKAATQQRVWARSDQDSRWQLGIVDLMLWIEHEDGTASEVWVEVKAGSLVTSRQLGTYLTAAEGAAAYIKTLPDVVTLWPPGQELPSKFVGRVETYTWDRLIDAIRPEDGAEWAALKKFIADRGLANHEPVPTDEALVKAIDEALGRTSEFRVVRSKGGSTRWRRKYSIRTELARQFASGSDYVIRLLSPHWVRLYIGLSYPLGVPTLRVQLGYAWDYPIPNEALRRLAMAASLDVRVWHMTPRLEDGVLFADHEWPFAADSDPAQWIVDRVADLSNHSLLVDLDNDGRVLDRHSTFA